MRTQKLRLEQLKVRSFVTEVSNSASEHVKGGCPTENTICSLVLPDCKASNCCATNEETVECN